MFKLLILSVLSFTLISCTSSKKQLPASDPPAEEPALNLNSPLPVDSKITTGTLDNGLKYYIRKNAKPENRAELRLVINAGSILEDDDQQGLAHLCEHMCFNGTKNFQKQELVNYLESIGMRFGPEINAYTSFDETVYMLLVPSDSLEILEKGFLVLEDWAANVSFEDEEIDKERGVVIEEWRLGQGANMRMLDKQFPILFKGSQYAKRLPIGQKTVLDTFHLDSPRRYYSDWYRPDLMAVIVVGDIDVEYIEELIKERFDKLEAVDNPRPRKLFPVPDHEETLFAIATDPEATNTSISVYFKKPVEDDNTIGAYRQRIVERLYNGMLNQRLHELTRQENPPFIYASTGNGRFVRTSEVYMLNATVKDDGLETGLATLLTEAKRVQSHGFTKSELDRQKKAILRSIEKSYSERDKNESRRYASEYIRNFLQDEPIPGIVYEYELYKKFVPDIKLEDVNALANSWITDHNRVLMISAPEKEGLRIPAEDELKAVMAKVDAETVEAYTDNVVDAPLVKNIPSPTAIVKTSTIDELGVTEWTLKNGIKVILKPTDFKNDEIRFSASSPGGYSLINDENLIAAKTATAVVSQGGYGQFNATQLQKLLADKVARVNPYISELSEGLSGMASPKDLETMFQLIYLAFTEPRPDSSAYLSYKSRLNAYLQNQSASPEAAYRDSLEATFNQNHPRYQPMSVETIDKMDMQKSFEIYRERFADASDFVFFFVGNFEFDKMKPLVETYLGGLPVSNREESWANKTFDYPGGVVEKEVKKGLEPKSLNTIIFSGPFEWNLENRSIANTLVEVFRIKLRERLREDKSGTYGVSVRGSFSHLPEERYQIRISFGCNPERVEELTKEIFSQIDSLSNFGTTDKYLEKVREIGLREYETNLKKNQFWLSKLQFSQFHNVDPKHILGIDERVKIRTVDEVQAAAKKYLNKDNYVRVILYPEN